MSAVGLSQLLSVPLPAEREVELERLASVAQGSAPWRARVGIEARELFALEMIDTRVRVEAIYGVTELRAVVRMRAPVACLEPGGALVVHDEAELLLRYPPAILSRPLPGMALVAIRRPHFAWHPNIGWHEPDGTPGPQSVCLGANIPRGLPLREVLVSTYTALTMQVVTLDERDPAGVLNLKALEYWRDRRESLPLSAEPFLGGGAR